MIEFQLTVYMCSYCTRVHNAAHDCLQHEREEHSPAVQSSSLSQLSSATPPTDTRDPSMIPVAEPLVELKRDHAPDEEDDLPLRKSIKIEESDNLTVDSPKERHLARLEEDGGPTVLSVPLTETTIPNEIVDNSAKQLIYQCDICKLRFSELDDFNFHITGSRIDAKGLHFAKKNKKRAICQLYASTDRQSYHGGPINGMFFCAACSLKTGERDIYEKHLLRDHHSFYIWVGKMIEFQLTVYMCSHCTRVHNAAQDCLQHEQDEHFIPAVESRRHSSFPAADDPIEQPSFAIDPPVVGLKLDIKNTLNNTLGETDAVPAVEFPIVTKKNKTPKLTRLSSLLNTSKVSSVGKKNTPRGRMSALKKSPAASAKMSQNKENSPVASRLRMRVKKTSPKTVMAKKLAISNSIVGVFENAKEPAVAAPALDLPPKTVLTEVNRSISTLRDGNQPTRYRCDTCKVKYKYLSDYNQHIGVTEIDYDNDVSARRQLQRRRSVCKLYAKNGKSVGCVDGEFYCVYCGFHTGDKRSYEKHLKTDSHERRLKQ